MEHIFIVIEDDGCFKKPVGTFSSEEDATYFANNIYSNPYSDVDDSSLTIEKWNIDEFNKNGFYFYEIKLFYDKQYGIGERDKAFAVELLTDYDLSYLKAVEGMVDFDEDFNVYSVIIYQSTKHKALDDGKKIIAEFAKELGKKVII